MGAFAILSITLVLALIPAWRGPICPVWLVFHIHCPGCGLTRSLIELWQGHLWLSLRYHPFGPPLFVCCLLVTAGALADWAVPSTQSLLRSTLARSRRPRILTPVACLLVLVWILRLLLEFGHNTVFLW